MSYYAEKQYIDELPQNAIKDLKILFFSSFFKDCKRILDVGCSVGRVISLDPKRIEGVDIDKVALKIASSKGYSVKFADVSRKLPFKDSSFDGVFCSHVIEHLFDPKKALLEMKRVLKNKGKIVIITPDYIMTSRKYKNGFWSDYTHKRPFIPESLEKLAFDCGFRKYRVYHFPSFGFRHLMRFGLLSKDQWIKLEKIPFIWKGQDLILEAVK
ncbi:MAG: class I SAM-dependent methyltransferase [Candidatus Pacearchaeota archaeon]